MVSGNLNLIVSDFLMPVRCRQVDPDITWYSRNCKDKNKVGELDRKTTDICFVWNLRAVGFFVCAITKALLEGGIGHFQGPTADGVIT